MVSVWEYIAVFRIFLGVLSGSTLRMGCRQKFLSGMKEFILLIYRSLRLRVGLDA